MIKDLKILIVDDDPDWAMTLSFLIENLSGITPVIRNNGREALELLKTEHFDVVLTDTNMPFVNGIELLIQIREKHSKVKVVVFFNQLLGSEIQKPDVIKLGASAVITKDQAMGLLPAVLQKITC